MILGLAVGMILAPLAGIMAFLITYHEYRRHYTTAGPARREALRTAVFTTLVFLAIAAVGGLVLERTL